MLSKNKIKFFNSLKLRKNRIKHNLFIAEGEKLVSELLKSKIKPEYIITTKDFSFNCGCEVIRTDMSGIKKISSLKTPPETAGVFNIPDYSFDMPDIHKNLSLYCDNIQNPGNLGTVLRTADWFGIKYVFLSKNTVDVYNPKTVQATMGAIASVKTIYINPDDFFGMLPEDFPVYGTFLEGKNIYETNLTKNGIIIIGNEGRGISDKAEKYVLERLFIPHFNENKRTESLNASVASAIIVSEFMRR